MSGVLISVASFIVALGVLITVHEFGHYWVARRLGVKILRFSVGFGKPLWSRRAGADQTEYVVAALPLGGYVKMLDENEGAVAQAERARAFNAKPVASRFAIVAAGPMFNFLFAVFAFWLMFVIGVVGIKPQIGHVTPDSPAARAGLHNGDVIVAVDGKPTPTWDAAVLALLAGALERQQVGVQVRAGRQGAVQERTLDLRAVKVLREKGSLLKNLGIRPWSPQFPAVIGKLEPAGPAARAGFQPGDRILAVDGTPVKDWDAWVKYIQTRPDRWLTVEIERGGKTRVLRLRSVALKTRQGVIGHIGAYGHVPVEQLKAMQAELRYSPLAAAQAATQRTWEMSALTLQVLWKMILGQASLDNISGPISIAQYAGYSARIGLAPFLAFLGVVSVSLAVLNLLPIPVLDGGHLMYYLIEFVKGKPVSQRAQLAAQKLGIALLLALMGLAFYNDLMRLFGG